MLLVVLLRRRRRRLLVLLLVVLLQDELLHQLLSLQLHAQTCHERSTFACVLAP